MKKIELDHVDFSYGENLVLKDISLSVHQGEIVSIIGPSGVGKTTLFNLIAGILPAQAGKILVDGEENPRGKVS